MDGAKSKGVSKLNFFKFTKNSESYDNLYYELLYDFADRRLSPKEEEIDVFRIREDGFKKQVIKTGVWYRLFEHMMTQVKNNNHSFSKLGYHYVLSKAKIKYRLLSREAIKINRQPKDIVRLYVNKCKDRKVYYSLQKVMKIGKFMNSNSNFGKSGIIQRFSAVDMDFLMKLGVKEGLEDVLPTVDNDKKGIFF